MVLLRKDTYTKEMAQQFSAAVEDYENRGPD